MRSDRASPDFFSRFLCYVPGEVADDNPTTLDCCP